MANSFQWHDIRVKVGDIVRLEYLIKEKGKERQQPFQGRVIAIKGSSPESKTFTVRRIAVDGVGVERIFPVQSPWIKELRVVGKPSKRIKRAKLYYLRQRHGKKARL